MRNQVNYDAAGVTSNAEADELFKKAPEFRDVVNEWLQDNHPQLG